MTLSTQALKQIQRHICFLANNPPRDPNLVMLYDSFRVITMLPYYIPSHIAL